MFRYIRLLMWMNVSAAFLWHPVHRSNAFSALPEVVHHFQPKTASQLNYGAISMDIDELSQKLGGTGRAKIVWDCYRVGIDPALFHLEPPNVGCGDDDTDSIYSLLPTKRRHQRLSKDSLNDLKSMYDSYSVGQVEDGVASISHVSVSLDLTTKLLLKLRDGLEIETVIIPWKNKRSTLCVSSQVGCRQGCTFCATGRMGKVRSLTSDEIIAQLFFARKICRQNNLPEVQNIVMMGMGEAADNVEQVSRAIKIITSPRLFRFSAKKVILSTVAPTPEAFQLAQLPCVIAWSVHAAGDELRRKLVPTTKYPMAVLRQALIESLLARSKNFRAAILEVALMADVNDSESNAIELADFARVIIDEVPYCKLAVNLIPFNDIGQDLYRKPTTEAVLAFRKQLWERGIYTTIRATRGDDESAACGQLATKKRITKEASPALST